MFGGSVEKTPETYRRVRQLWYIQFIHCVRRKLEESLAMRGLRCLAHQSVLIHLYFSLASKVTFSTQPVGRQLIALPLVAWSYLDSAQHCGRPLLECQRRYSVLAIQIDSPEQKRHIEQTGEHWTQFRQSPGIIHAEVMKSRGSHMHLP